MVKGTQTRWRVASRSKSGLVLYRANGHVQTSVILQVIAWFALATYAVLHLSGYWAFVIFQATSGEATAINVVCVLVPAALLFLARGIRRKDGWARTSGLLLGFVMLAGFPVGTLVGGYVLFQLVLRWDELPTQSQP